MLRRDGLENRDDKTMRLLNVDTLKFQEFYDAEIPQYIILSHRWSDDEITYKDFRKGRNQESKGYAKVFQFCDQVRLRGYSWAWVDTCCIDKSSSAELSEAINSMYNWYRNAEMCLAFLADVCKGTDSHELVASFRQSDWFDRGWTLQELLAPKHVYFYDKCWNLIGSKDNFANLIAKRTGIAYDKVVDPSGIRQACIAERMSWAADRRTSRVEDMAYCLLGIFNVNMPLLYGEGSRAFRRLQEELIHRSDDETIFAFDATPPELDERVRTMPALPGTPSVYKGNTFSKGMGAKLTTRLPYTVTHSGVQMDITYVEYKSDIWFVPMGCFDRATNRTFFMVLTSSRNRSEKSKGCKYRLRVPQSWVYSRLPDVEARARRNSLELKSATVFLALDDALEMMTIPVLRDYLPTRQLTILCERRSPV